MKHYQPLHISNNENMRKHRALYRPARKQIKDEETIRIILISNITASKIKKQSNLYALLNYGN